jgi:hypothetical protein
VHDLAIVIVVSQISVVADGRSLSKIDQMNLRTREGTEETLNSVLMDESTAVNQLFAKMVLSVLLRRAYLIRYSK